VSALPADDYLDEVVARMATANQPADEPRPGRVTRTIRPPADEADLLPWYDAWAAEIGVKPHRALIMALVAFRAAVERGKGGTTQ
jgi:hypothetical protein